MTNHHKNLDHIPHGGVVADPKLLGSLRLGEPIKMDGYAVNLDGQPQEACSVKEHVPADLWSEWPRKL